MAKKAAKRRDFLENPSASSFDDDSLIGGFHASTRSSTAVVLNVSGKIVGKANGQGANPQLMDIATCINQIVRVLEKARRAAKAAEPLFVVGIALNGCEGKDFEDFCDMLEEHYGYISKYYTILNEAVSDISATSENGGVVLIAGVSSNTFLLNPDGKEIRCGGWGRLISDDGSSFRMVITAIKYCFDTLDGFKIAPHPIDSVWHQVKTFFEIEDQKGMMHHLYTDFSKEFIAGFVKPLSKLAEEGDKLAQEVYGQCGMNLARSLCSVLPKASPELKDSKGAYTVLCTGSVWLKWNLLKKGFVAYLSKNCPVDKLNFGQLRTLRSVGAAYLAAVQFQIPLTKNFSSNIQIFYTFKK